MRFGRVHQHKRVVLTMLVIAVVAGFFWGGSRYPTLNEKAIMGGATQLEDPLAFMAVIHSQPSDPLYMKIAISTINWCAENQKGMTFGFLLGAGFLSLFSLFQKRGTNSAFLNTLIGIGMGAPLGVCVNCAAPIARGLHSSGARIETTLSAMFSSPTMNIVVLTMLFTLFPVYLIVIKLGLTLVFLLIAIPVLSRTVFHVGRSVCDVRQHSNEHRLPGSVHRGRLGRRAVLPHAAVCGDTDQAAVGGGGPAGWYAVRAGLQIPRLQTGPVLRLDD